jgi:hypothetical protein
VRGTPHAPRTVSALALPPGITTSDPYPSLVQQDDKSAQPTRARTYREHRYAGSA